LTDASNNLIHHDLIHHEQADELAATPHDSFLTEFTRSQRPLFLYVLSLVPHPLDAEEILQETNLIIWKKKDLFEPGSNFYAWASRIAHYEVLKYRDRKGRNKLQFSQEFVQQVSEEIENSGELWEPKRQALMVCLQKLRDKDREIIQLRYAPGNNGKNVAETLGRPVNSVYQSLSRIRQTLLKCIRRQLSAGVGG